MSRLFSLDLANTALACVCYLGQPSTARTQHAVRALGRRIDETRILLAFLGTEALKPAEQSFGALATSGAFGATVEAIVRATSEQPAGAPDRAKAAAVS
jgi:hypothetical protein